MIFFMFFPLLLIYKKLSVSNMRIMTSKNLTNITLLSIGYAGVSKITHYKHSKHGKF